MDKKKYKKTYTQPRVVGHVNYKKSPKRIDKKRIAAYFLLGFMIFWTICSCLTIYLFFDREKDSAMITANAEEVVDPAATNNQAFEIFLDGLTSTYFNWTDGSNSGVAQFGYKVSFFYQQGVEFGLRFYDLNSNVSNTSYQDVFLYQKQALSFAPSYFTLDHYTGVAIPFVLQWQSSTSTPIVGDEVPIQVTYLSTSRIISQTGYSGYTISMLFLSSTGSIREYRLYFGVEGSSMTSGLQGSSDRFFTVPLAPMTYQDYIAYGLSADSMDSLRDENRQLYERISELENQLDEYFSDGVSQGYDYGFTAGYNDGYFDGVAESNDYSFIGLISAVVDVPVKTFIGLFDFDLLGFNMANFFLSLLSLSFIIKIVSLFF